MNELLIVIVFAVALLIYFLPTAVAYGARHHNQNAIFALNLFLGWTLIGWVLALIWALSRRPPSSAQAAQ